jgi:hypothetical protein
MSEHVIKVQPPYMDSLRDGTKTFEVRRNDRAYQAGDTLLLVDHGVCTCSNPDCELRVHQSPSLRFDVTFVYSGDPRFDGHGGMQWGYVVLGIRPAGTTEEQ